MSKARRPGPESATSRWSFHFAVHAIDANQTQFVLGVDQGGLTSAQARSVVADLGQATEVVAARKEGVDASQCWRRSKEFLGRLALSRPLVRPATVRPAGERDVPAPGRPSKAQRPVTYSLVGPAIERVCRRLEDEFDGPAGGVAPFTGSVQAAHRVSDLTRDRATQLAGSELAVTARTTRAQAGRPNKDLLLEAKHRRNQPNYSAIPAQGRPLEGRPSA